MTTTIATKTCGRCNQAKSIDNFSKHSKGFDGYQNRCKQCAKENYWSKREDLIEKKREYNLKNKDSINAKHKVYREEFPEKNKERKLKYYYNITLDQYNEMLDSQNHVCAICEGTNESSGKDLFVDHDHSCCPGGRSCGECVRGLLCNDCNLSIGRMRDDPIRLTKAVEYILEFRA